MNFYFIKIKIITAIFLFTLLPSVLFAQTSKQICSSDGYTITTINGVFTDENGAIANRDALKYYFDDTYNGETLTVHYLLNPSHLGGIGDLAMSVIQKAFEDETVGGYDLVEMLKDASAKVKTQKLLLVAHSQGNFYANSFYDVVAGQIGGLPEQSIGVYSVANPASRVAGKGKWLTSDTDKVIATTVGNVPFKNIMPPNIHIELQPGDEFAGHGFSSVYLKYKSVEIVAGIQASLDKLSADPERRADTLCIDPPKISFMHKVEGAVLAVADPVANAGIATTAATVNAGIFVVKTTVNAGVIATVWTYNTAVATAVWAYNTTLAIVNAVANTAVAVASTISAGVTSLINSTGNLANSNSASVILATASLPSVSIQTTSSPSLPQQPSLSNTATLSRAPANNGIEVTSAIVSNKEVLGNAQEVTPTKAILASTQSGGSSGGSYANSNSAQQVLGTQETLQTSSLVAPILTVSQCVSSSLATDGCLLATTTVRFEWSAVSGALYYAINKNGTYATTTNATLDINVQDFSDYIFDVSAVGTNGQSSATSSQTVSIATIPVAINEIAWMGTLASANDEWIELKNNTAHNIDLSQWVLSTKDGTPYVKLMGAISPRAYLIFERTNDTTISGVTAHQIYTGALSNDGEQLNLSYASTTLDQTPSGAWVAGYNSTTIRRTMERVSSKVSGADISNWGTNDSLIKNGTDALGNAIDGTPGAENSVSVLHEADRVAPVITMQGSNPATVSVGLSYADDGATAVDAIDGARAVIVTSNVDTSRAGTYSVIYVASDLSQNTSTSTRTVNVVDSIEVLPILFSDLNANGIADADESDVVATSTMSLPAGEYHFNNLTITNNAILTLVGNATSSDTFKGVKIVATNITINPNSAISADGKGDRTGTGFPSSVSAGGSHGGVGLNNIATSTYGSAKQPINLGSGGGSPYAIGGGAIRLIVSGTLVNNGVISADGNTSSSGGSIYVTAGNMTGAGAFHSNGGGLGVGGYFSGPGGGGRIAVYYQTSSFAGTAEALGGRGSYDGWSMTYAEKGTVGFFDSTTNDLHLDSSWRFQANDGPFNFNHISISNGASVTMDEGVVITANELTVSGASTLTSSKGSSLTIPMVTVDGATVNFSGEETLAINTLALTNRATVTIVPERTLSLSVTNLVVGAGSIISADIKGYGSGVGSGSSPVYSIAGSSYGGAGMWNTSTSTYGSMREPVDMGSGGYGYHTRGGGVIRLVVSGNLENNGSISAVGGNTSSGGSIYVTTNNLLGTGEFHAEGGSVYCPNICFGSGGGGRIAVYYRTSSFNGVTSAFGQNSYYGRSEDGTVVMEQVVSAPPAPATPSLSSARSITTFDLLIATSTVSGVIDEIAHTVSLTVPFGTDVRALPAIMTVSPLATSSPASGTSQDFTNPVIYTITAEDGSIQSYTATVTIAPDTASPTIVSYTFNSVAGDIVADFATTTPTISMVLIASENVDWVSIKIEDQNTPSNYKTFFSGVGCVDGTTMCTKSWDGALSSGARALDGMYRVKVHIKDMAGNLYQDYLSPYSITINTATP